MLTEDGRISGIIDWGDVTSGDAATDLASIWMLLEDPAARRIAWTRYGAASESLHARAKGWAVFFGAMLLDTGLVDNPRDASMGERTLKRVAHDT